MQTKNYQVVAQGKVRVIGYRTTYTAACKLACSKSRDYDRVFVQLVPMPGQTAAPLAMFVAGERVV